MYRVYLWKVNILEETVNTVLELGSKVELMSVVVSVDVYLRKVNILEETVNTVLELGSEVELMSVVG
jgi:hypothetical protein